MPAQLDTCLFTTSGTEANDLAWRLATAYTGGTGAIVAEHAYHGSSKWLADLSPNEWPPGYHPAHVATFAAPRASTGGTDHATAVARITQAAQALRADGDQPALVLADLGFTSEGVLDAPPDFLQGLIDGTHAEGALFVADEVQIGFGRIGQALWRFAAADVVPDIVTLGKPMAAGYPMGAVITRCEIAERLAQDYEYFSTFAATPAAAAASLAVLETLQEGDLPRQVTVLGDYLQARLREVATTTPHLGEVRGRGLVIGVDTFGPSGAAEPEFAKALLNELVSHHTLAGLTGPSPSTVLKIRPPLVWTQSHADQFITALTASLAALV
jgi:4-aminobutyrate aminotransferase-like enzyme